MKKYTCSVCGYIYDEAAGDPDRGFAPGTKWEDLPMEWDCPLCGAAKTDFEEETGYSQLAVKEASEENHEEDALRELFFGEASVLCSNLSKGCAKQYRFPEAELFNQLAEFYQGLDQNQSAGQMEEVSQMVDWDLDSLYVKAHTTAAEAGDRGALRALVWGEKVTKILKSILSRYDKQQDKLLESTHIYVCDICGFIYIGDDLPEVCPVCKVPNKKILEVKRG